MVPGVCVQCTDAHKEFGTEEASNSSCWQAPIARFQMSMVHDSKGRRILETA